MIWIFRTLFTLTLLGAGVALFFFLAGMADKTVTSKNIVLWLGLLAVVLGVPVTGGILHYRDYLWAALGVLLITALPAIFGLAAVLIMIFFPPRWN